MEATDKTGFFLEYDLVCAFQRPCMIRLRALISAGLRARAAGTEQRIVLIDFLARGTAGIVEPS
jgi:hypothetical protein